MERRRLPEACSAIVLACWGLAAPVAARAAAGACGGAVAAAVTKSAATRLKVVEHCRRLAAKKRLDPSVTCVPGDPGFHHASAQTIATAGRAAGARIRRRCAGVAPTEFPWSSCPADGAPAGDVETLVACAEAVVEKRIDALLADVRVAPSSRLGSCGGGVIPPRACATDDDCAGQCNLSNLRCRDDAGCPADTCGRCAMTGEACGSEADCAQVDRCVPGSCIANTCTFPSGFDECGFGTECPIRICALSREQCATDADCPTVPARCSVGAEECRQDADCRGLGACARTGSECTTDRDCTRNTCEPKCWLSGRSCSADPDCVPHCDKRCFLTNTPCSTNEDCGTPTPCESGSCLNARCFPGADACSVDADCPRRCRLGSFTCTADADCPVAPPFCQGTCGEGFGAQGCFTDTECAPVCNRPGPTTCVN
jgi:hypothetical protein